MKSWLTKRDHLSVVREQGGVVWRGCWQTWRHSGRETVTDSLGDSMAVKSGVQSLDSNSDSTIY